LFVELAKQSGEDLSGRAVARARLREAAEKARRALSVATSTKISVQYLEVGENGPIHLETTLTQVQLESITGTSSMAHSSAVQDSAPAPPPQATVVPGPPPAKTRSWGLRVVAVLVAVLMVCGVAGAGVWWVTSRPAAVPGSGDQAPAASMAVPADAFSIDAAQVVDDLVKAAGGNRFLEIDLFSTHASAKAPTTPGATTVERFTWRDGQAKRDGPASGRVSTGELFDVTTVDCGKVAGLVAQVPGLTKLVHGRPSVNITRATTGGASPAAKLVVRTSDGYHSASITADASGKIVWMSGGAPGSKSEAWAAAGLLTTEHLQQAIDDLVEVAGGPRFFDIHVYPTHIYARAPTAPGAATVDRFTWRDGFAKRDKADSPLSDDVLFDATAVDWKSVEGIVAQIEELTGIKDGSPAVHVDNPRQTKKRASTPMHIHVSVSGEKDTANIVADARGKIVWMDGGVTGSKSEAWASKRS